MTTELIRPPDPGTTPRAGDGRRRWWWGGVTAVAVLALASAAVLWGTDDERDTVRPAASAAPSAPAASTAPSTQPSAQPSATGAPAPVVDRSTAVWPVAGSSVRYTDPVAAARGFATGYLDFEAPVVGAFAQGDSRSGEVEVRPTSNGPATTVLVRQLSGESSWSVLGATTANVTVTEPPAGAVVRSPVTVRGSALAFEGHVVVQVRQDGRTAPLGEGFVTGGGDVMRPYTGSIPFAAPSAEYGALVLMTRSAKDGSLWEASVLRVGLRSGGTSSAACPLRPAARPGAGQMSVTAWFTCDPTARAVPAPVAVTRVVPRSTAVLRASLDALLAGPTAEERSAGISSFFSSATAGAVRSVTLTGGRAVVDLRDLRTTISGASSSAGSALLLSELDATVFQFSSVTTAEYRFEGSCTAFTDWVQVGGCTPRTRP